MASAPPLAPAQPSRAASILQAIARAYFARERQRLGITAEEREAQAAATTDLVKRAQLARLAQEMELAPAEAGLRTRLIEAQIRNYDEPNRLPPAAPKPPNVGSFEDYVIQKYGARPTAEQIADARRVYQQADDRPRAASTTILPYVVSIGGQPTVIDRRTGKPVEGVQPAPTAAERNVAAGATAAQQAQRLARQRAAPVLQDLGSRVLTANLGSRGGLGARIRGMGRSAAGSMGMDSAADLYNTGVRGFVPLFARAVGHVGVLTELDVKRTEDLFPRFGADAEDVVREKLARLNRIMTGQEPLPFQFEHPKYDAGGITQQPGGDAATPPSADDDADPLGILGGR